MVGRGTLAALNVPVEARIDQLRVNLERMRWVFRDVKDVDEFLLVNVAGFRAYRVRDQEFVWSARAQVGKPYRKTPVFQAKMTYLEFNPTWTVPPTILRRDVLPRLEKDPGYLKQKNMRVLDLNGRVIDPATIDWSNVSRRRFPYMIRQEPGPQNALGRVKFIFPNKYFVFLHDTPSRALFERSERAFSSGCIRVEKPLELATDLLAPNEGWDRQRIDEVVASGKTTRVNLERGMPVLLMYWTAGVQADGTVMFYNDVYDRDQRVLEALNAPFRFVAPDGYSD